MSELKPCPWQMPDEKVHDVRVYDVDEGDSGTIGFTVSCNDCLIDGPQAMAKKRAVELWNRRASPWVRVEDGLPAHYQDVLIRLSCCENAVISATWHGIDNHFFSNITGHDYPDATHWMPIPEIES